MHAYADDIKVTAIYSETEKEAVQQALTKSVERMLQWTNFWHLKVNFRKSQHLPIGSLSLNVYNNELGDMLVSREVRDFGVLVGNGLNFESHIDAVAAKGLRVLHCLFRNVSSSDPFLWIKLFKMFLLPLIEYCGPVWSPYRSRILTKLKVCRGRLPEYSTTESLRTQAIRRAYPHIKFVCAS